MSTFLPLPDTSSFSSSVSALSAHLLTYSGDDSDGVEERPAEIPLHAAVVVRVAAVVALHLRLADHRPLELLQHLPRRHRPVLPPQDVELLCGVEREEGAI